MTNTKRELIIWKNVKYWLELFWVTLFNFNIFKYYWIIISYTFEVNEFNDN